MEIEMPFRENMAQAILEGRKFCTSRNKKYGEVGDIFRVTAGKLSGDYKILAQTKHTLDFIAWILHHAEGFDGYFEFVKAWDEIHPRKGFISNQLVWVHWFERVE
jgi:hypothetical protein